jgi:G:T-mismatch repair DNA endonuclease (very short patch repair protein)
MERDRSQQAALTSVGWKVMVIWECETRNPRKLAELVNRIKCVDG